MGWFHSIKLHIVISDKGEILNFTVTQANVDNKGYIGKNLMQLLFTDGFHLITHIKNNMKNALMTYK